MAQRIGTNDFEVRVLASAGPVVVDFYSDTCVPCKRLSSTIAKVEPQFEGRASFVKVNVNYDLGLAERYGVMATPTLVVFRGGEEVARRQGALAKDDLASLVEQAL